MRFSTVRRNRIILCVVLMAVAALCFQYWSLKFTGSPFLPKGAKSPVVQVGRSHAVVIAPNGTMWSWGGETLGWPVLGMGQTNHNPAFGQNLRKIGNDTNWMNVSAGHDHNLALKSDGTLWSWGANYRGQLGNGKSGVQTLPVQIDTATDWTSVVAGYVGSYGLKSDGSLWAWGLNNFCQLGIGFTKNVGTPTRVGVSTNWVEVAAGGVSAAGIQSDGSLWIWGGSPEFGNTGSKSLHTYGSPTRFAEESHWTSVSVAFNVWLGVKADGTLWAWGREAHVLTGAPTNAFNTPIQVGTDADWQACVSSPVGSYNHMLVKRDKSIWWLSSPDRSYGSTRIVRIGTPEDVSYVGFGGFGVGTGAFITSSGEVWTWGAELGARSVKEKMYSAVQRLGFSIELDIESPPIVREGAWQLRVMNPE
jgi:hypothetical protein